MCSVVCLSALTQSLAAIVQTFVSFNFQLIGDVIMKIVKYLAILGFAAALTACAHAGNKDVAQSSQQKDIVDTAVAAGSFNTLATALQEADLIGTLKGDGPFTVFAPTDEAFAKIPQDQLNALLGNKEMLIKVLTYHVVPGKIMAADVTAGQVMTVEGQPLTITTGNGVMVNNANVIKTDIVASNGVIHVIDAVVLPN